MEKRYNFCSLMPRSTLILNIYNFRIEMDLQDGGAEQDIMEGHPGGGEQETETETPDTHTEKESNSPSQSTKQAESRQGDITDGDHSETPQDKDGDNLCVKEKEENVKSNEDFPGSGGDGSDSPSRVTLTDTLDSSKHARDSDEEKDSEASKASQSREQNESLDPEDKAHSEAAGNKETVVVIDDLQTLPPEQSDPDQVDKSTQRKEKGVCQIPFTPLPLQCYHGQVCLFDLK